ncbi:MAG: hypothetical protein WAZ34_06755 [Rhodocyclaceae bacterium]
MPTPNLPDATALMASLLSQMTRFSCLGCPQQAALIQRELALLQTYPDSQIPPLLKGVAKRLEGEWTQLHFAIADDPEPASHDSAHPALH